MEPIRLELENFMGHKHTIIDCTLFSSALIVAKGVSNQDISNGAGKSTLFKAVEYVLFGEYEAKTLDELVRKGCDSGKVIFDFKVNDAIYRIERSRNRKTAKSDFRLWEQKNGAWSKEGDLTQKTSSELEQELTKIIKINHSAFRNSVLFAQDDLLNLASAKTPQERKNILKEVLSLALYSKLEKLAREEAGITNKKIQSQKSLISALGDPDKDIKDIQSKLKETSDALVILNESKKTSQLELDQLRIQSQQFQKSVDLEFSTLKTELSTLRQRKEQTVRDLNVTTNLMKSKQDEIQNLSDSLNDQLATLTKLVHEKEVLQAKALRPRDVVEGELEFAKTNESKGRSFIFSLEAKIQDLKKPLPDGDSCPHCRQMLSKEHRLACAAKMTEDVKKANDDLEKYKVKLETVKNKRISLEEELKSIATTEVKIANYQTKIDSKKAEINQSQSFVKKVQSMLDQLVETQKRHQTSLTEQSEQENQLKIKIDKLNISNVQEDIYNLNEKIKQLEGEVQSTTDKIAESNTNIGILTERFNVRQEDAKRFKSYKEELEKLEKDFQISQLVVQGFSAGGIPTMIIYTILDDLQIEANKILSELRPGMEMQFSVTKSKADGAQEDTLDISYRLHGNEFSYELLSGGQRYMIALALRLGLSAVIQNRLGVDIKFLELDEVDEKLDKAAVAALALLLRKLQDKFKILVITHNDQLKDKFAHAILIEYHEKEGSTAKVVSSW